MLQDGAREQENNGSSAIIAVFISHVTALSRKFKIGLSGLRNG